MRHIRLPRVAAPMAAAIFTIPANLFAGSPNYTIPAQDAPKPAASEKPGKALDNFEAEWKKLNDDLRKANEEYYEPYFASLKDAKTEEDKQKVKLDPSKDPTPAFAAKYLEFAKRATGTDSGLNAVQWLLQQPMRFGGSAPKWVADGAQFALDEIVKTYLQHPNVARTVGMLAYATRALEKKTVADALAKIEKESKNREVQSTAAFAMLNSEDPPDFRKGGDEGRTAERAKKLRTLIAKYDGTASAKRAAGEIFELEHLRVGMTVPEVTGTDQEGKGFKLSYYRGKVVVLDFWGFW
ncbi:MAG: hypothetical protein HY286_02420 [Planctomycetes bacterium]|nr:hypothetical protein [Planctomycetota bacterium]